jgi:transposase
MKQENLQLNKIKIDSLPLIEAAANHMGLRQLLESALQHDSHVTAVLGLVKNVLTSRSALYRVKDWAKEFDPNLIGSVELNDDILGRALDKLFAADRASLQSKITLAAVKNFGISMETIHNDSTAVSLFGSYNEQEKKAAQLRRGHSKDHRPDLKQIVFGLSVTADGAVPIHSKSYDGNTTDDTTHQESWTTLRGLIGRSDFLYVADSKLCTEDNMRFIDVNQGSFITIVPRTRAEIRMFEEKAFAGDIRWEKLWQKANSRKKSETDYYEVAEGLHQLREGYRVFWYRSSQKTKRDAETRNDLIETAWEKLETLANEKKRGPKTQKALEKSVSSILTKYKVDEWIKVEIKAEDDISYKQESRGKPGSNASYKRVIKKKFKLVIKKNPEGIARSQVMDGVFPLTTNTKYDALKVLQHYKYQPNLEKRFSLFKSVCEVAPIYLKSNRRIEALMFIYFIAMLIAAVLERRLRKEMETQGIKSIKSLPEERPSATPTWEQIVRLFEGFSRYDLMESKKLVRSFNDNPSEIQKQILSLVSLKSASAFY